MLSSPLTLLDDGLFGIEGREKQEKVAYPMATNGLVKELSEPISLGTSIMACVLDRKSVV